MRKRGGGISAIELVDKTDVLANYYQLHCTFETLDAMGANFINSCLEAFAETLENEAEKAALPIAVIMSILSNYVPNCLVKAAVSCPITEKGDKHSVSQKFAEKMMQAVAIAKAEPYHSCTQQRTMNGIDALVLATGIDFRATSLVHAFAAKDGQYSSLTHATIADNQFTFGLRPLF